MNPRRFQRTLLSLLLAAALPATAGQETSPAAKRPPSINREAATVFQRAFWRRLAEEDHVLHAERREWRNEEGAVERWEWFLAVRPGPALASYLREENPFHLSPQPAPALCESAPDWFPKVAKGFQVQQNAAGMMVFLWRRDDGVLFATDSGGGFRPGAPQAPRSPSTPQAPARLPLAPP
jgi:hypothetical protein